MRRLGKQRVEALMILRGLHRPDFAWRNHPAVRMWRGYDEALLCYAVAITRRWRALGFKDTVLDMLLTEAPAPPRSQTELARRRRLPAWLGMRAFHRSHQSALVRKNPVHYRPFFPDVPDDLPYVWPAPATRRAFRARTSSAAPASPAAAPRPRVPPARNSRFRPRPETKSRVD
jgi:hypothetical protein